MRAGSLILSKVQKYILNLLAGFSTVGLGGFKEPVFLEVFF